MGGWKHEWLDIGRDGEHTLTEKEKEKEKAKAKAKAKEKEKFEPKQEPGIRKRAKEENLLSVPTLLISTTDLLLCWFADLNQQFLTYTWLRNKHPAFRYLFTYTVHEKNKDFRNWNENLVSGIYSG